MLLTKKSEDFISDHLEVENKPITFKFLSRELDFSVSQSKNILLEYYDKFKSNKKFNLHYCITGTSKNGNILIKITSMNGLNKSKEEFKTIKSCDIFSIELASNLSLSNIVSINESTKKPYNEINMTKWGLIQTHTSIYLANEPETRESKPAIRIKTEPVKSETEAKARKGIDASKESEPANRSAYVSRKASTIPSSKAEGKLEKKSEQPITSLYKSRKNPPKRKSEVIIDDIQDDFIDGEDDDLTTLARKKTKVETEEQRRKKEENLKMLDTMFDDDDFSDDDVKEEKESERLQNNDIDIDVDIVEQSDSDDKINDMNSNTYDGDAEIANPSDENAIEINEGLKPIDKFVHKKTENDKVADVEQAKEEPVVETFVDDDGYVVRKVNKKVASSKSKSNASSKPSTKNFTVDTKKDNKLNKKQASLMSFFKKK